MKIIYLSLKVLQKSKMLSIILCVEVLIGMYFNVITINSLNHGKKELDIVEKANLQNSLFYMGNLNNDIQTNKYFSEENLLEYLENKEIYCGRSTHTIFEIENNGKKIYASSYDEISSEKLSIQDINGQWYDNVKLKNGIIPCVVMNTKNYGSNYQIGDIINGNITSYMFNEEDEEIQFKYEKEYQFQVVGIIDRSNAFALTYSTNIIMGEVVPGIDQLFSKVAANTETILCGNFSGLQVNDEMYGIIYLSEDASKQEIDEIYNEVSKYGSCYKIKDMMEKSHKILYSDLKIEIPQYINILNIILVGIISISFLNSLNSLKKIGIYNLCGCSWRKCYFVYFISMFMVFVLSFFIGLIILHLNYLNDQRGLYYLYYLSPKIIIISLCIVIIISLFASYIPFVFYKNKTIIDRIHISK